MAEPHRAWDDVYFFQPGEKMYDRVLQWVTTMLQQQQAGGLLRQQQAGRDVVYNQFAVGEIGGKLIRTVPKGSPMVHCEEQLIKMIKQPQDHFIIYTENFTCQMRAGTDKRCNCFFQVSQTRQNSRQQRTFTSDWFSSSLASSLFLSFPPLLSFSLLSFPSHLPSSAAFPLPSSHRVFFRCSANSLTLALFRSLI